MPAKKTVTKKTVKKTAAAQKAVIDGREGGKRLPSRVLEEHIQEAVAAGARTLTIKADGQHGIGGRLWSRGEKIKITVEGPVGQRMACMGHIDTEITVKGSVSDDAGWINCGAKITVLGNVTNGAHNAAAQGKLYVQGGGGARCDTMTKHNPRFAPPESWYFRDVGDSFAEFKAGGIAVVCGVNPRNPENILGYRPCVGMVGGTVFFRGPIQGFSENDVKLVDLTPQDWDWLTEHMKPYLKAIKREEYYEELTRDIKSWKKLIAYTPAERSARKKKPMTMAEFRSQRWEDAVGKGGIFGPFLNHPQTAIPYVPVGEDRRSRPVWANDKYLPPCAYHCPSRIPSHKRATMIRQGKTKDALELVLQYSPMPATVCGEICPNLCMTACTRGRVDRPLDIKEYGRLALELKAPKPAKDTGYTIGVVGGGPAGLSAAWQLRLKGHAVNLYEVEDKLGGKIELAIPRERLPQSILDKELSRFRELGVKLHLGKRVDRKSFEKIYKDNDFVVVACGAHQPRELKFTGSKDTQSAIDFLKGINFGYPPDLKGQSVVVIGAGNVGMDVACSAYECGAKSVVAVDVQQPAAFGKELDAATAKGTEIVWPKFTEKYDKKNKKIHFTDGTSLPADLVVISVGEVPILDFLTQEIHTERGWIVVNDKMQTSDVKVYAIGDATKPGLVTDAIGQGRVAAEVIHSELMHYDYQAEIQQQVPYERLRGEYYDLCRVSFKSPEAEANVCMSCGSCRDCHMCEETCYWGAISRVEQKDGTFEYVVDASKCIGCGFCAGICPCGVWEMEDNI